MTEVVDPAEQAAWTRSAPAFGWTAAAALVVGTALFLIDVLGAEPTIRFTSSGFEHDLATYYADWFGHQRTLLWNIASRELALFLAFALLGVLVVHACRRLGPLRPSTTVLRTFFGIGVVLHIAADFMFLGNTAVWRKTGWAADPASNMIAAGRTAEAIGAVSDAIEVASLLALIAALAALVIALSPHRWRLLRVTSVTQAVSMGILAVGLAADADALVATGGLASGLLAGPTFAIAIGRFGTGAERASDVPLS